MNVQMIICRYEKMDISEKKRKIQVFQLFRQKYNFIADPTSQPSTQLRLPITSNLARDARSCNAVPARNNYAFKYVEALSRWGSNLEAHPLFARPICFDAR